jgi:hypothetical protein
VFEARLDPSRERGPLELVADELARALDDTPLLVPIAARLGDLRFEGAAPTSAVEVRRAANAEAQARAAADAVHAALASGTPLDRIAVALPRLDDEVIWPLRAALDTAGIVAHEPRGRAPMRAGIVAVALEALAIGARGLPRRDVARLLSSRYLDAQALTGESERRAAVALLLDLARALEETPTARDADARAALVATARAFRAAGDDRVEARASLASRVAEILAAPNLARTHAAHVAAARALFAALGLAPRMGAGARTALADDARPEGIARAELAALAEDAHAWDVLAGALDSYDAAARRLGVADAPSAGESFRHHVTRVLEVGAPPLGAARAGAVRIARLADLAGEDLALLVVVDANDGILPGAPSSDPLLPEELARALGAAPAPLRRARELASLALAAAGAERVVLTYRLRDEQGGAMAPAPLAAWLERAGAPTTTFRASPLAERPLSLADARLGWLARAPEHAASLAPEAARRASIERRREEFFYDAARAADDRTGRIAPSAELARALADDTGAARPLAITSLESAARCPFQGFASIVLRARDPSIRGELPDAREQGSIVHEALAAAFRATAALWPARPRDANAIEERALAAAESVLARELVGSPLRDVVLARARDDVRAVLAFSLADIEWDFALAEQAFGEGGPWAPLRLEAAGAPLLLRGKIDRVDLAHEAPFTRAIDYKSSRRAADAGTREMGTTAFQVPLYALVAARATGKASARGLYLPTPARDLEGGVREVDAERWAGLLARVPDAAAEIIGRIREGALAPVPHDERACIFCHVRGGCRKPRFAVAVQDGDLGDSRAT